MLQTCNRCRNRRIKCDSALPACTNCAKNDLECTSRDEALGRDISRSLIKSLEDRIQDLNSQIAVYHHQQEGTDPGGDFPNQYTEPWSQPSRVWMPGIGQYMVLGFSPPSMIVQTTLEALVSYPEIPESLYNYDNSILPPANPKADRTSVTPSVVRFLLSRYDTCIRPRYPIFVPDFSEEDSARLRKLPTPRLFHILMACAIAAAGESYKLPDWRGIAYVCREWADELLIPIISWRDGESLQAITLLLVYELAEPSRGIIWDLLDLAIRTYLQLGWHRNALTFDNTRHNSLHDSAEREVYHSQSTQIQLIHVIKDIEASLHMIFDRPNMLTHVGLPFSSAEDPFFRIYFKISEQLYGKGQVYQSQNCPFTGEISNLLDQLGNIHEPQPIIYQTWLLLLPICLKHEQCVFCLREPNQIDGKGMRTLRGHIIQAASSLLDHVRNTASSKHGFISPLIASSHAITAGCAIAVSIYKEWIPRTSHINDLMICSEILALFAPHWRGGQIYLETWRYLTKALA